MKEFLEGVLLGLGLAIPIGPITIVMMSQAIYSYKHSVVTGLGAMSVDLIYFFLVSFGVLKILDNQNYFNVLAIVGSLFLIYLAYGMVRGSSKEFEPKKNLQLNSLLKTYFKGFLLNLVNPYIIIFWLSIATIVATMGDKFAYGFFGIAFGVGIWITLFPLIIYKSRKFFSLKMQKNLSYFSAVVLLFFAFNLLYKIFVKGIL